MNRYRNWVLAILLSSPIVLFNLAYLFNHDSGLVPTGFIQYDNVTYTGNAIQYNWPEHTGIFYANRLNDSHSYEPIYFNPQLLILAGLMRIGIAPGFALMLFNLLSAILFFRLAISIYDHVKRGNEFRLLNIVLFSWGGGLLCVSGFLLHLLGAAKTNIWSSLFMLDPAHGWWGLNLGRSLFFSMEAWYHALFFAVILSILKKKWTIAVALLLLLSLSHPFTGIELLLILFAWMIIEIAMSKSAIPVYFSLAVVFILAFHIWYYLVYLDKFPEHHSIFQQYSLNWRYRFYHFIPAYILTACLLVIAIRIEGVRNYFSRSSNRLFICWAVVAFTLANHELFIKPMQPLHFTRGYIWSALFLAGLPGLHFLWRFFSARKGGAIFIFICSFIFLTDNLLWIVKNSRRINEPSSVTLITKEQEQILRYLSLNAGYSDLIVGSDEVIPYLASIYTKSSIWFSHPYNTPYFAFKLESYNTFIETGSMERNPPWSHQRSYFIIDRLNPKEVNRLGSDPAAELVLESGNYLLYLRSPTEIKDELNQ